MIVEDYTPDYYQNRLGAPLPSTYAGKFVHIVGPADEYLVLSPTELTEFHAQIVQRFSRRRPDTSSVFLPSGEVRFGTPGWSVRGGGHFQLNRAGNCLALWGASKAYGAFDGDYVRVVLGQNADWLHYEIALGQPD
jgi:hypothetical protein